MKRLCGTAIVVALLLAEPSRAVLTPGLTTNVPIMFDSLARTYDVYVPPSYTGTTPYPLVLDFHGYGVGSAGQPAISGLQQVADAEGFIVVYPQGYGTPASWNGGGCCDPALSAGLDDVGFAKAIAEDVAAQGNIDGRRIYATGHSNGSIMAQRLACDASDFFAAVAGVAAPVLFQSAAPTCTPARPMPVLHVAGIDDMVVPYLGGPTLVLPAVLVASAADNFLHWRTVGGCTSASPDVLETFPTGGSCATYNACAGGVQVSLCSLHGTDGLKHFLGAGYSNSEGVQTPQRLWDFLSQFTLPEPGCGDGIVAGGETCDDGDLAAGDGCNGSCQIEPGWACSGQPSACTTTCGDGVPAGTETCDDGGVAPGDGCSATCQIEAGCSCTGTPSACTCSEALAVAPTKLILSATASKAKLVFVAKDAAITKGSGIDPATIEVELTVAYGNGSATGTFLLPQADAGWIINRSTVAKFLNRSAPTGSTVAKVSLVKPGKLVKLVGKGLGDSPLDLVAAGDPAGPVHTAYCVTNAGERICLCSSLTDCTYKSTAAGTGAKLVCRAGTGDPGCQAVAP